MIYPQNFEQKIGFDEIRTLLTGHCLSTLGIERVVQMKFLTDLHLLRELQEQTREFLRIQEGEEDFPEQDFYDVRPAIKRIRIEGTYLDETELFDLKRSLCTIINIVRFLNKETEEYNDTEESRPADAASAVRSLTASACCSESSSAGAVSEISGEKSSGGGSVFFLGIKCPPFSS